VSGLFTVVVFWAFATSMNTRTLAFATVVVTEGDVWVVVELLPKESTALALIGLILLIPLTAVNERKALADPKETV
jgi:dipeptide/tripeptide permease